MKHITGKILAGCVSLVVIGIAAIGSINTDRTQLNQIEDPTLQSEGLPLCDGTNVTQNCQDDTGTAYKTYLQHDAVAETTKEVTHPAIPAVTRTI